jgi:hypothetical protein
VLLSYVPLREEVGFDGYIKSSTSRSAQFYDNRLGLWRGTAERQNAEGRKGGRAEGRKGGRAEERNGGTAERRNGGTAE